MARQPAAPSDAGRPGFFDAPAGDRHWRLRHRGGPAAALAAVAFALGAIIGGIHDDSERQAAERYGQAWARGDYASMYRLLSEQARAQTPVSEFVEAHREAAVTATETGKAVGDPRGPDDGVVSLPVNVRTRIFGTVGGEVRLPFSGGGDEARIDWKPNMTFPGVPVAGRLERSTRLRERADILARDGSGLAKGSERESDVATAAEVVGELGDIPPERRQPLRAAGYPDDAQVGLSGLERVFEARLAGRPGGELRAGGRVIARSSPRGGRAVKTTIDPELEQAAVNALAGRFGAIAVMRPQTGEVLALSGIAFSGLQPPGSTMKVITIVGGLEEKIVKPEDTFPVTSATTLEGVRLENANGELCGGTLVDSFVHSCNSVFAPLGAKLGARRLVEYAERFGFNEPPGIPGAATSTIPAAGEIGDDLAVGSSAIGQGKVQATALQMASVAATIATGGLRARPNLLDGQRTKVTRVTPTRIARRVGRMMQGVVRGGTGTAAAIPGLDVAGKTGTAELGNAIGGEQIPGDTDAWFIAYAPGSRPRLAVGVLLVRAGAGGGVAAPAARQVLATALAEE